MSDGPHCPNEQMDTHPDSGNSGIFHGNPEKTENMPAETPKKNPWTEGWASLTQKITAGAQDLAAKTRRQSPPPSTPSPGLAPPGVSIRDWLGGLGPDDAVEGANIGIIAGAEPKPAEIPVGSQTQEGELPAEEKESADWQRNFYKSLNSLKQGWTAFQAQADATIDEIKKNEQFAQLGTKIQTGLNEIGTASIKLFHEVQKNFDTPLSPVLLPWEDLDSTFGESLIADQNMASAVSMELRTRVLLLAQRPEDTFAVLPTPDFVVDWDNMLPVARRLLVEDATLANVRHRYVPSKMKEEAFWLTYFWKLEMVAKTIEDEIITGKFVPPPPPPIQPPKPLTMSVPQNSALLPAAAGPDYPEKDHRTVAGGSYAAEHRQENGSLERTPPSHIQADAVQKAQKTSENEPTLDEFDKLLEEIGVTSTVNAPKASEAMNSAFDDDDLAAFEQELLSSK